MATLSTSASKTNLHYGRVIVCRLRGHRWSAEREEAGGATYVVGHFCERCYRYERLR